MFYTNDSWRENFAKLMELNFKEHLNSDGS